MLMVAWFDFLDKNKLKSSDAIYKNFTIIAYYCFLRVILQNGVGRHETTLF